MATRKERKERVIYLPKEVLAKCNGFSFDFGGSVIKVCYMAKGDWEKDGDGAEGPLRLISFAREELEECLQFLMEKSYVRRNKESDRPVIYTSGIGSYQYGKRIEENLQVVIENTSEMDGFVMTMEHLLKHKPLEDFCVPIDEKIAKSCLEEGKIIVRSLNASTEKGIQATLLNPSAAEEMEKKHNAAAKIDTYVLGMFGSAWVCMKMGACYSEGQYSYCNMTTVAGRSFLGLGCLLTGAENYEELMELAEKGNNLNIDITEQEVAEKTDETKASSRGDIYSDWSEDASQRAIFSWGKAVGKKLSDFRREDVARTLLQTFCHHLAITAYDSLHLGKARHIFLGGGFCNHPLVQRLVTDEFEFRKWSMAATLFDTDGDYHVHFLKYGGHFGAIGAILQGVKISEKKESEN